MDIDFQSTSQQIFQELQLEISGKSCIADSLSCMLQVPFYISQEEYLFGENAYQAEMNGQ